jgi:spore germination cell wall hydrolase CwlJ-like protein
MTKQEKQILRIKKRVKRVAITSTIAVSLAAISLITTIAANVSAKKVETAPTKGEKVIEFVTEETTPKKPRYDATPEELEIVARVVHTEAHGEDYKGQVLVAQCILNTAEATGKRPDEVVLSRNQYAAPATKASKSVTKAVNAVFIDGYTVTDEPIRYFYAPKYTYSEWHENSLDYVLTHGGHRFFKEN